MVTKAANVDMYLCPVKLLTALGSMRLIVQFLYVTSARVNNG